MGSPFQSPNCNPMTLSGFRTWFREHLGLGGHLWFMLKIRKQTNNDINNNKKIKQTRLGLPFLERLGKSPHPGRGQPELGLLHPEEPQSTWGHVASPRNLCQGPGPLHTTHSIVSTGQSLWTKPASVRRGPISGLAPPSPGTVAGTFPNQR